MSKRIIGLAAAVAFVSLGMMGCNPCPDASFERPDGHASVTIAVDDTANGTYESGQMSWKGSWTYDEATNVATYDGGWGGGTGPYPKLYDDGPICEGGHEAPDAVAGDGIHTAEVYVALPTEGDQGYEYGMENELGNWIWQGSNGEFTITAESDVVTADGMTIAAHGTTDMKLTIDTANLNSEFQTAWDAADPAEQLMFAKGSMNAWTPVECVDDGTKGDETADDDIYTFVFSENIGIHDGLLKSGDEVAFVFVLYDAEGSEYKVGGDAVDDGVTAYTMPDGGSWTEATIEEVTDGYGAINTAITVP